MSVYVLEYTSDFLEVSNCQNLRLRYLFIDLLYEILFKLTHSHRVKSVHLYVFLLALFELFEGWLKEGSIFRAHYLTQHALLDQVLQHLKNLLAFGDAVVELDLHLFKVFVACNQFFHLSHLLPQQLIFFG